MIQVLGSLNETRSTLPSTQFSFCSLLYLDFEMIAICDEDGHPMEKTSFTEEEGGDVQLKLNEAERMMDSVHSQGSEKTTLNQIRPVL